MSSFRTRFLAVLAMALPLSFVSGAERPPFTRGVLINEDVVLLAEADYSERFIVETIMSSSTRFDVSAAGLAELAKHKLTERIVRVMQSVTATAEQSLPLSRAGAASADSKVRVFVEQHSAAAEPAATAAPVPRNPRTVEIMKAFGENCPDLTITSKREEADYSVALARQRSKLILRGSKMVAFDRSGDMVFQTAKGGLDSVVRSFCASARMIRAATKSGSSCSLAVGSPGVTHEAAN